MRTTPARWLHWTPRVLTALYAAFLAMFALDVFDEGLGPWRTALALLVHLVPTWFVLAVLAASWRREWIAGVLFPLIGALYVAWAWDRPFAGWTTYAMISGPLVLAGVLFLLDWRARARTRPPVRQPT